MKASEKGKRGKEKKKEEKKGRTGEREGRKECSSQELKPWPFYS